MDNRTEKDMALERLANLLASILEKYAEKVDCPTAHCERYKPHFDFGDIPSPIVPHRNKPQTQGGMTAH